MKFASWAAVSVFLVLVGVTISTKHQVAAFHDLHEAKAKFADSGFCCTSDAENGTMGGGFLISRQSVSWHEAGTLCKTGKMGANWKGKVWVTVNPSHWRLETIPDEAGTRVWGDVVAFGDVELLSEMDEAVQ